MDGAVGECQRAGVCGYRARDECIATQSDKCIDAARQDEERESDEEGEKRRETDGAKKGGRCVADGCGEDLT